MKAAPAPAPAPASNQERPPQSHRRTDAPTSNPEALSNRASDWSTAERRRQARASDRCIANLCPTLPPLPLRSNVPPAHFLSCPKPDALPSADSNRQHTCSSRLESLGPLSTGLCRLQASTAPRSCILPALRVSDDLEQPPPQRSKIVLTAVGVFFYLLVTESFS